MTTPPFNTDPLLSLNPGLITAGNIDLTNRPVAKNKDGTISTVRSITVTTPAGAVLLPTVIKGKVVSDRVAIKHFLSTGEHLGIFKSEDWANKYAELLHQQQAAQYASNERSK